MGLGHGGIGPRAILSGTRHVFVTTSSSRPAMHEVVLHIRCKVRKTLMSFLEVRQGVNAFCFLFSSDAIDATTSSPLLVVRLLKPAFNGRGFP
jgi:hypothetical protein